MAGLDAMRAALNLLHIPTAVRRAKEAPLPDGVELLLRLVAGDAEVEQDFATRTERPVAEIRRASTFFVEQVLLFRDADSYRILGVSPSAPIAEIRRNMALLLRWLHPDVIKTAERRVLVDRVTLAWEDLKTPERRATYDGVLRSRASQTRARKSRDHGPKAVASRAAPHQSTYMMLGSGGGGGDLGSAKNRGPANNWLTFFYHKSFFLLFGRLPSR